MSGIKKPPILKENVSGASLVLRQIGSGWMTDLFLIYSMGIFGMQEKNAELIKKLLETKILL